MKHQNVRNRLIENTVKTIAKQGLDKTTTKAIVTGTDINEAYIYRSFRDKEDLLAQTFAELDEELVSATLKGIEVMYLHDLDFKLRCRLFFNDTWRFLLGNREKCLAFIRYFYSPYYQKYSAVEHKERFLPLVDKISPVFRKEANVWMILNHILNVMLDFAVKVYSGSLSDSEDTEEHVFRLIYVSVEQYFKSNEEKSQ